MMLRMLVCCLAGIAASHSSMADPAADREAFAAAYRQYQQLSQEGRFEEAVPFARRAHELGIELYGPKDRNSAALALNLGKTLRLGGHAGEASPILKSAVAAYEAVYGRESLELVDPLMELGHATLDSNAGAGSRYYSRALKIIEQSKGRDTVLYADLSMEAGLEMMYSAGTTASRRYLDDAHEIFAARLGPADVRTVHAALHLGKNHLSTRDFEAAERYLTEVLKAHDEGTQPDELQMTARAFLVELYEQQGRSDLATEHSLAIGRATQEISTENYAPLFRPQPEHAQRSQASFVIVEFTVNAQGRPVEAVVVESDAPKAFEAIALATVARYRYAPRFVDGQPVPTAGVRDRVEFQSRSADARSERCEAAYMRFKNDRLASRQQRQQFRPIYLPVECL